ncbi:hypothetical protein KBZ94_28090 [Streptomyces sp. RM72]|uniref:hypothetical protein n=1 Tax=unclassified Streptomyces TaxID=2593676 RepID=UPI001B35D3FC|nr:hypothetical protein [Streptomyces sp. RM72]MBQ0888729.1 hypothetical protein [Streptomyces sp. RM72]
MPTTLTDIQPQHSRTDRPLGALETAGTGRHRGRRAEGDVWTAGSETVGHGRHRRSTCVMAPGPVTASDDPGIGGRLDG